MAHNTNKLSNWQSLKLHAILPLLVDITGPLDVIYTGVVVGLGVTLSSTVVPVVLEVDPVEDALVVTGLVPLKYSYALVSNF